MFKYVFYQKHRDILNPNEIIDRAEIFENKNPILARIEVLQFYNQFMKGLAEANLTTKILVDNLPYDEIPEIGIFFFIENFNDALWETYPGGYLGSNWGGIHAVNNEEIKKTISDFGMEGLSVEKIKANSYEFPLIHYFGEEGLNIEVKDLETELQIYKHFNFDTKAYERQIEHFDINSESLRKANILDLPIDWDKEVDKNIEKLRGYRFKNILTGIQEDNQNEFKETLLHDIKTGNSNKQLGIEVAIAVTAFMNAEGGTVYIGRDDSGVDVGLERDLIHVNNNVDKLQLKLSDILANYIINYHKVFPLIKAIYDNKNKILVLKIDQSSFPSYIKNERGTEFYVRQSNRSKKLQINEAVEYISYRFKNV